MLSHVQALRQAELEFYIWANQSYLPFAQLVTDLGVRMQ
jgi:hypothetical protein